MTTANERDDRGFLRAAAGHWHPVARAEDVVPGTVVPVTLLGQDLALWRGTDGSLGVVDDLCSHRGTRLSQGSVGGDGCVRCPYHGWRYAADGRCVEIPQLPDGPIPSRASASAHAVVESAGLVWVNLDAAASGSPPVFERVGDPGWAHYCGLPMDWACQATRQIENFLDIAHFSVLHVDAFGNEDHPEVPPHDVTTDLEAGTITTSFVYQGRDVLAGPGPDGLFPATPMEFDYAVLLPFAVRIRSFSHGYSHEMMVATCPVTATSSRVFWVAAMPREHAVDPALIQAGEDVIFGADRRIVEEQRPERLPLDLTAELQMPFDRLAVAYRRALAAMGFPVAPNPAVPADAVS